MEQDRVIRVLVTERAKLLAYAWSMLRDEHVAEDVFQEVMLLAIEKRETIENERALMAWARTATRYRALHAARNHQRTPPTLDASLLDQLDAHWKKYDDVPSSNLLDALQECVAKLTPYARRIVALRYKEGLTGQEVADSLNRKVRTIYMALTRIHSSLRECIGDQLAEES